MFFFSDLFLFEILLKSLKNGIARTFAVIYLFSCFFSVCVYVSSCCFFSSLSSISVSVFHSIDTVTCLSPSSLFSRKTGDLLNSQPLLLFSEEKNVNNKYSSLVKRSPIILENTVDGDTRITVSIVV